MPLSIPSIVSSEIPIYLLSSMLITITWKANRLKYFKVQLMFVKLVCIYLLTLLGPYSGLDELIVRQEGSITLGSSQNQGRTFKTSFEGVGTARRTYSWHHTWHTNETIPILNYEHRTGTQAPPRQDHHQM